MEFDNLDFRPGKSWNFCPGHGKLWNLTKVMEFDFGKLVE